VRRAASSSSAAPSSSPSSRHAAAIRTRTRADSYGAGTESQLALESSVKFMITGAVLLTAVSLDAATRLRSNESR
jgi:hypothetical protein